MAIVANDGGLPAGTRFACGLVLKEQVPQGHKVALADLVDGAPVLRYSVPIGYAMKPVAAGSWVHEGLLKMPPARSLNDLPIAKAARSPLPALQGYTFDETNGSETKFNSSLTRYG